MDEDTLRAVLRDISEEVTQVNLIEKVLKGRTRRRIALGAAGAAVVAALAGGITPLALASTGSHQPSPSPTAPVTHDPSPSPVPSESGPSVSPSPGPTGSAPDSSPVPSESGPASSPEPTRSAPAASPSPSGLGSTPVPSGSGPAPSSSPAHY
jgi:hypothetical protein